MELIGRSILRAAIRLVIHGRSVLILAAALLATLFFPHFTPRAYAQIPGFSDRKYDPDKEAERMIKQVELDEERKANAERLERSQRLIVMIRGELGDTPTIGAGIVFGRDKDKLYVLTANHVVRRGNVEARNLSIKMRTLPDRPLLAHVLSHFDSETDLAVIGIEGLAGQGIDVCALDFALLNSATPKRGASVFPVGNPNGIGWAMPVNPDLVAQVTGNKIVFQSTFISQGHSGGALLNERGLLTGMIQTNEPPFASAIALNSALQPIRRWDYPVDLMDHDVEIAPLLNVAAANGDIRTIQRILAACGNANATGAEDMTPLHEASLHGQLEAVKFVIAAGADVNAKSRYNQETPLQSAAMGGNVEIVQLLLSLGAKIEAHGTYGWTPLHFASFYGKLDVVKLLLAHGAVVDARGRDNDTPLDLAASAKHQDILELLVTAGASINSKRTDGWTPIHVAASSGNLAAVKSLLAAGADVNSRLPDGRTPLAVTGASDIEELLRAHGGIR